jgi:hypothetical protein
MNEFIYSSNELGLSVKESIKLLENWDKNKKAGE